LTRRFGTVGLAAVAYNGGETRAKNFVAKTNGLAQETIDYVQIITGQTAEDWRDTPPKTLNLALDPTKSFMQSCLILAKKRRLSKLKSLNPKPNSPFGAFKWQRDQPAPRPKQGTPAMPVIVEL
jgi:hypothetical protein